MSDPYTPTHDPFAAEQALQQFNAQQDLKIGTTELDGKLFPVVGDITVTELALWEPKFVVGDPKIDDDKYFSVWDMTSFVGGGQIETMNINSDVQRYYHGTADAMFPDQVSLPLQTLDYGLAENVAGDTVIPIGDYQVDATIKFWAAFGTKLAHWDPGTLAWVDDANLTAAPYGAGKGIVFDNLLYIPQGPSGYDTWDGLAVTHHTDVKAVSFVEWDDKLISLGSDGQIGRFDGVDWYLPTAMKLRGNRVPRKLEVWWTPGREPAVFIGTNRDVWACDFLNEVVVRTGLKFPVHPDFGLGFAAWQDDAVYISVGVGMHQLSLGGVVDEMGPDRDSGLPSYLRGKIVDIEPEYNGMLTLIQGIGTSVVTGDSGIAIEETMLYDGSPVVPTASVSARSALFRWTGDGWHCLWESASSNGTPTKVIVSEANGDYRMWWGYGARMFTQPLRRSFYKPKQGVALGIDRFELSGYLITGQFNAGMTMFKKNASHLEVFLDPVSDGAIDVSYRTDASDAFVLLGTASEPGLTTLGFDLDGDGWAEGLVFRWIQFRFDFRSDAAAASPIANWFSLKFIKIPLQTKSFSFVVPLDFPELWNGRSADEIKAHLDHLASGPIFSTFKHQGDTYRVRLARTSGEDATGVDRTGSRQVNLIELRLTS